MPARVPRSWLRLTDEPQPSKYRNKPIIIGGRRFASRKEGNRALLLMQWERSGKIKALEFQPRFPLAVNGQHICVYVGDFSYYENGERVIEDAKGMKTREYVIKRALMKAIYGIEVREV